MKPGLHKPSAAAALTLQELEQEARRLNADTLRVVLDDRDDIIGAAGLGAWADILEARIANAVFADEDAERNERRAS